MKSLYAESGDSDGNNELEAVLDGAMVTSRIRDYNEGLRYHLHEVVRWLLEPVFPLFSPSSSGSRMYHLHLCLKDL